MKKFDLIIIVSVLLISALTYIFMNFSAKSDTVYAVITIDGKEVQKITLDDPLQDITIENRYGTNKIEISSDGVSVVYSDCTSQTCVHTGKITRTGQIIACLPHHLMISLEGVYEEDSIDATTR